MAEAAQTRRLPPATIALIVAGLILVAVVVIVATRSGDAVDPVANAAAPGAAATGTPEQAIAAMRRMLEQNPDNAEGWAQLGFTYRETGQEREAEAAFRRASELQPNNPTFLAYRAEALLLIDPVARRQEANQILDRVLQLRPNDPQARYYRATLRDMDGDHRGAVDDLVALLRDAPAGAPWATQVRSAAELIASRNNIDIDGRLPPAQPASSATAAIPGPTREQMEAARSIPPGQQDAMVKGMVDRLAARLQQNPRDENGWMMLMRSRMVQQDRAGASAALRSGLAAFPDDAAVQQRLREAAQQLGVPG